MSTKFLSPGWRMPRNANQSKQSNYSMSFDGSSQYISTGFTISSTSSYTLSAWFKTTTTTQDRIILGDFNSSAQNASARAILGFNGTRIYLNMGDGTNQDNNYGSGYNASLYFDGNWHLYTLTINGFTQKAYLDGTLVETWTSSVTAGTAGERGYTIGRYGDFTSTNYFNGQIDGVAIFDYVLSPSQVITLYGTGSAIGNPMALPSPPIAYYPLGTSAWNGQYLAENNAIGDYVFDFIPNDYIAVPASTNFNFGTGDFTISTWVNIDAFGSYPYLFDFRSATAATNNDAENVITFYFDNNRINVYANGTLYIGASGTQLSTGLWYNIILKRESGTLSTHINGGSADQTATYNGNMNTTPKLNIGARGDGINGLNGKFSNFQVFNTALSATDIQTLYNYGSPIRTLANIPQSSNLKAWYKLDASEVYNSTTTEWSINNALSPWTSSLDFDGSNDYIDVGSFSLNVNAGTGSAWIKSSNTSDFQMIIAKTGQTSGADQFMLRTETDGRIRIILYYNNTYLSLYSTATVLDGNWHHVAFTYSSSGVNIYIDGSASGSDTTNVSPLETTTENFMIGARKISAPQKFFNGSISNVQVFSTALSGSEVETLYNNGSPIENLSDIPQNSNLQGWWKLNNITTGIEDSSGNENNGTNSGAVEAIGSVSTLNGESSGMTQANLVQSDLQTVAPYSKYALDFDASSSDYITVLDSSDLQLINTDFSISFWINPSSVGNYILMDKYAAGSGWGVYLQSGSLRFIAYPSSWQTITTISQNVWTHILIVGDNSGNNLLCYKNGAEVYNSSYALSISSNTTDLIIGSENGTSFFTNGKLSNASIWNTALTSAQVSEIYNEGLPGNLNSHSAYSNLVSWWQLGENSSFDGNDWIVADEKGTNNGTSTGMPVGALVNGVGTTANGLSSGMSEGNLVGDAPYSTANAISSGMSIVSRVSGVSDATITTGGTGYSTGTNIATTGGSGTNCTINITTVSGGAITAITINSGGNNYLIGDVLTVSGGNGNATITVSGLNTP